MEKNTITIKNHWGAKIYFSCLHLWNIIITIGITDDMSLWEKKRTRLLNGICTMATVAYFGFVLGYASPKERIVFWESFQGFIFYIIPVVLNYYRRPVLAAHFFCVYNLLCYTYFAISHGKVDGAEYYLLTSGISAMLFFRSVRTIVIYFVLNLGFFWICKYSFTVMHPILVMPDGENLYVQNQTLLFILCFLIVFYFRTENTRQENLLETKSNKLLEEKIKSDNLLLNILPAETAEELKTMGSAKAKYFNSVSVMFTDFQNFTLISQQMPPEELVAEIDLYFSSFDTIVSKYQIEKIKTIGDAYMCAAGLPNKTDRHAVDTVGAALEILDFVAMRKTERIVVNKPYFSLRIGINSGPVVAGIVGTKKFAYDIWGDTVNVASRMESCSEKGRINISGTTYELVKDQYNCVYRGKINAKNKGMIDMYFVEV